MISVLEEIAEPFRGFARMKISDILKEGFKIMKEDYAQGKCINGLVPKGKVWCDYYNSIPAGRCNTKCKGYSLRK